MTVINFVEDTLYTLYVYAWNIGTRCLVINLWTIPQMHFYAVKVDGKSTKVESGVIARTQARRYSKI